MTYRKLIYYSWKEKKKEFTFMIPIVQKHNNLPHHFKIITFIHINWLELLIFISICPPLFWDKRTYVIASLLLYMML